MLYMARRYLFTGSSNNAINIISGIAAAGVIVGTMALFIVLSGFAGLKQFSLQYTTLIDPELKIGPAEGKIFEIDPQTWEDLLALEGVEGLSGVLEERVFLNYRGKNHIAYIKGVDQQYTLIHPIDSIMLVSDWFEPEAFEVVIGLGTAYKLSLGARDYQDMLEIYVPRKGVVPVSDLDAANAFRKEQVVVSGVYEINEELNEKYVFSDLSLARRLLQAEDHDYSSVEVALTPEADLEEVKESIVALLGEHVWVKDRIQQNDALYKMLNTENLAVYLIFTLVLVIALFNVVGSIIMMILDKRGNIKTLHNLGAKLSEIRAVFYYQGILMTILGGSVGIILGSLLVYLQQQFSLVNITPSLPYPVEFKWLNVGLVLATIVLLGAVASRLAASRVGSRLVS
jgi:lipoprotein-releasing system permease protein